MKKYRPLILSVLLLMVLGTVGAWMVGRGDRAENGNLIRREELLNALALQGIQVKESFPTNSYALFGLHPEDSLGIRSDAGDLDVLFFPRTVEGQLEVTEVGENSWRIHNWRPSPQEFGSNHPLYFTIHQNLFIMAHNQEVHLQVQRALHRR